MEVIIHMTVTVIITADITSRERKQWRLAIKGSLFSIIHTVSEASVTRERHSRGDSTRLGEWINEITSCDCDCMFNVQ